MKWAIALLFVATIVAGAKWYSGRSAAPPPDYRTAEISRGEIIQTVTANGQIGPVTNVAVGTQVSGIIKEVLADFNSRVTNGQVVARIDPSTYEQNIFQSEAELANAQAALEYARLNHRRAEDLRKNDLISPSDYDKTVVDFHQAEAVAKMREAALRRSRVDLERTTILAPINGIVISRNVDVGQTVAASFNTPTLFQIANDLSKMQIEAMVSEADVGGVEEGQSVSFTVDAFQGRQFRGTIRQVRYAPVTNQNVVNYTTVVDVENRDLKLRPGMTAYASIILATRSDVLRIPNATFLFRPPTNAVIAGVTNSPSDSGRGAGGSSGGGTNDLAGRPAEGVGGRGEEMRRRMENMSPEEREQMRARFQGRRGEGGGGGAGAGGLSGVRRGGAAGGVASRTVYLLDGTSTPGRPVLKRAAIKTGISDGTYTEVLEGLNEGDVVVTGLNISIARTARGPQGSTPMGSPFGGMRRGGPGR